MKPDAEPIRITRGPGGEVEVDGPIDPLARDILRHAGFLFEPALHGQWVRLPFDMGRDWENRHATWATEILIAARYPVRLDPELRFETSRTPAPSPAMTAQAPPGRRQHR